MDRWRRNAGFAALLAATTLSLAHAARPEEAPPESRAQVEVALRALAPAWPSGPRKFARGQPGTLEFAIAKFAPKKFHPVVEGSLPSVRAGLICQDGMASVGSRFCIDRYEATLAERTPEGTLAAHSPFDVPDPNVRYVARSAAGVVPQAYVSGSVAEGACKLAGKRLCQPVEWRMACGGKQGTTYPYGPSQKPGVCHDTGKAPMLVYHADSLKRGWGLAEMNDPRLDQLEGTLLPTGSHEGCANEYGVHDMVGSLHEWTADPNGTFQGGYWLDTHEHGDGCAYRTIAHPFSYHDYSIGFRCCSDGDPLARDRSESAERGDAGSK